MTIWILAILLMASTALAGWRQGAIRASFSFVGILFATLLAGLIGRLVHPLLPHLGADNPITAWALAPIVGFIVISVAFKVAARPVHNKVEHYYKYTAGDLRLALWSRMNTRLGICVGLLNGALYFILVSFVVFNLSYWTTQVAAAPQQSWTIRLVNNLGKDLQSSHLDRAVCAVGTMPPMYYQLADLSGLIMQNPQTGQRLADYPGLMSLWERDDMQSLVSDATLTNAPAAGTKLGTILDDPAVISFLKNKELTKLVTGVLQTNISDLMDYMKTGKSAKYS
ncbi:MAG TPA: CvpA family protein, partial [Candidatus Binatia bacterium]|nr:CvpA family protein [Candidatus Binatia bacterium]